MECGHLEGNLFAMVINHLLTEIMKCHPTTLGESNVMQM